MNRKEVSALLDHLEDKYAVENWQINGIHIWPVVKFEVFMKWRAMQYKGYDALLRDGAGKKEKENKFSTILKSFLKLFLLLLSPRQSRKIIFSGSRDHRIQFKNQFLNRYFKPLADECRKTYSIKPLYIEYGPKLPAAKYDDIENIIFLSDYFRAAKLLLTFTGKKQLKPSLDGFDCFVAAINKEIPELLDYNEYVTSLKKKVRTLEANAFVYQIIFRKYSVEIAMELCYYALPVYSLNVAASRSGLRTVDMQHGGVGTTHPAYNNFKKLPAGGYNVLPKYFWAWDQATANILRGWTTRQNYHRVLVGGNPWLRYFLSMSKPPIWVKHKKVILYTMQLNLPEQFIIDAIKKTSDEYEWWLRMHPRTLNAKKPLIESLIEQDVFGLVNLEEATSLPLAEILVNSVIHISRSSGSVIEATQLGVKTIIIHEIGIENYLEYVNNNDAIACINPTTAELISAIRDNERRVTLQVPKDIGNYKDVLHLLISNEIKSA
jgi:hypothetical protein